MNLQFCSDAFACTCVQPLPDLVRYQHTWGRLKEVLVRLRLPASFCTGGLASVFVLYHGTDQSLPF